MPWRGHRRGTWLSNSNISVYIFGVLFITWLAFQIWSRYGGGPPPVGLDPMVMAALGVAVTTKSAERKDIAAETSRRVDRLERFAKDSHPEAAGRHELNND